MSNDLVLVEQALAPLAPNFAQVLPPDLPPERIIRTVLVSCEMTPYLMECERGSLLRAAMTAAVIGLEVDGVTGQGYLVPFKRKVQFLPGYKGFVTIAARSKRNLEGFIVREGDGFEFDEAAGQVIHKRVLGNESARKVVAAYAISRSNAAPTILRVMSLDQLMDTRDKSAGYQSLGARSTWATNFEAMCRKTPMRRLAADVPNISLQTAAALDTQHDLGREAYIRQDRTMVVDGAAAPQPAGPQPPPVGLTDRPAFKIMLSNETVELPDATAYAAKMRKLLDKADPEQARTFKKRNEAHALLLAQTYRDPKLSSVVDWLNSVP